MKVRVFDDIIIFSNYITDEKVRKLLEDNEVFQLTELREKIVDIDLNEIILSEDVERGKNYEMGFTYCNRLYDIIHNEYKLRGDDYSLQYEIIENGYLEDIPWCETIFESISEFDKWMRDKWCEENE